MLLADRSSGRVFIRSCSQNHWLSVMPPRLPPPPNTHSWVAASQSCCTQPPAAPKPTFCPPSLPPAPSPPQHSQLGGSEPELLHAAAKAAAAYGYDELNLNCGCPSDRVAGAGCFGASLMLQAQLVADCMAAIRAGAAEGGGQPRVSVKCR